MGKARKASPSASPVAKANKTSAKGKKSTNTQAEVIDKILNFLYEMYDMGKTDGVKEDQVLKESGYARTDSTGYRMAMKEVIKNLGYVEKKGGSGSSKLLGLTEKGIEYMNSKNGGTASTKPTTNKEVEEHLKNRILKFSKGKAPLKALNAIWDVLKDKKWHPKEELIQAGGYRRADSTGYREIMKHMKQLDIVEVGSGAKKGSFKFNCQTVYPFSK